MEITSISKSIIGAAGEHLVLGELLRRGWIAAKAPDGAPNMDIVTTDPLGHRLTAIQVKTRRGPLAGGWHMGEKHDNLHADKMFYVFCDLGDSDQSKPEYYIIPSKVVADCCRLSHQIWEQTPGRDGQKHNHSSMRMLVKAYKREGNVIATKEQEEWIDYHGAGWINRYRDAWNLLKGE